MTARIEDVERIVKKYGIDPSDGLREVRYDAFHDWYVGIRDMPSGLLDPDSKDGRKILNCEFDVLSLLDMFEEDLKEYVKTKSRDEKIKCPVCGKIGTKASLELGDVVIKCCDSCIDRYKKLPFWDAIFLHKLDIQRNIIKNMEDDAK